VITWNSAHYLNRDLPRGNRPCFAKRVQNNAGDLAAVRLMAVGTGFSFNF
jgi:hypothetical protein